MRYLVTAWGSETHPPIRFETDDDPREFLKACRYQFQEVALQEPIPYSRIMKALEEK